MESLAKKDVIESQSKTDFLDSLDEKRDRIISKTCLIQAFAN